LRFLARRIAGTAPFEDADPMPQRSLRAASPHRLSKDAKRVELANRDGPDATTVITEANYRDVVWPLPAADLLGVGRATSAKLARLGIRTIGGIANAAPAHLKSWLGKQGLFLWAYANGKDAPPVAQMGGESVAKSVGNSISFIPAASIIGDLRLV
jgi:nucleotidyltransferase/DNA polymerase involved in DNA repair